MRRRGKYLLSLAMLGLALLFPFAQKGVAQGLPSEQSARAAMVFNFLRFTEFPRGRVDKAAVLSLCAAVRDARQAEALLALSGRQVAGRKLDVVEFASSDNGCDVLYVDSRQQWNALEDYSRRRNALTVGGYPGFARDGGMIEIAVQKDGIQFDINLGEGRRAGLHFAPQLLRLARQIHE